jgi:prepilin peptidase CpaA
VERYLLFSALLVAIAGSVADLRGRRIPNRLTYCALTAGLLTRLLVLGWSGLKDGLIGLAVGGGLFFFLYCIGGMGAGDVKLFAGVNAWAGIAYTVNLLAGTAIAGGFMALGMVLYRKSAAATIRNSIELIRHHLIVGFQPHPNLNVKASGSIRVPFAPAIVVGTLYCLSQTFSWG